MSLLEMFLVKTSETLQYPKHANHYEHNSYEIWDLIAPEGIGMNLNIVYMDVESNADFVYIGNSLQAFNTTSEHWIMMTGSHRGTWKNFTSTSISIIFTSNGIISRSNLGFMIDCFAAKNETEGKYINVTWKQHWGVFCDQLIRSEYKIENFRICKINNKSRIIIQADMENIQQMKPKLMLKR